MNSRPQPQPHWQHFHHLGCLRNSSPGSSDGRGGNSNLHGRGGDGEGASEEGAPTEGGPFKERCSKEGGSEEGAPTEGGSFKERCSKEGGSEEGGSEEGAGWQGAMLISPCSGRL